MLNFRNIDAHFETFRGRYGFNITCLYGSWGLNICLDFCWWGFFLEVPKK
jgi:hypothetical protein